MSKICINAISDLNCIYFVKVMFFCNKFFNIISFTKVDEISSREVFLICIVAY